MPFGGRLDAHGASFRLWAPAARTVTLHLPETRRNVVMARREGGWHEARVPNLMAGVVYQYVIDGARAVPDPASRFQPSDVDGPSELIDPAAFDWPDDAWRGRPWHEAVIYELHVGTFTCEGTFAAAETDLERLASLGITAIELMPLADFAGKRNWGYDGVLPFAPDSRYGNPAALKRFVAAAHALGVMVFLDVVYNHLGPEGNYLGSYAPAFFAAAETGWGPAINFAVRPVRDFFIENALYWVLEYNVDGLRLDAVHAIRDDSRPDILEELAARVRLAVAPDRHVHLVLENDRNQARYLRRAADGRAACYDAQWNDDFHHAAHVVLTGETAGYYADFAVDPIAKLGRALAEGFAFQGERSAYRAAPRGEPSAGLPPVAFVNFLQNHDQIGNRACGERLTALAEPAALAAAQAILFLAPAAPLLFMGEEWNATTPFLFFCDFAGALGAAVRDGRRREFAKFRAFAAPGAVARIPDPLAPATFERSQLARAASGERPPATPTIRRLLEVRHREIVPRLPGAGGGRYAVAGTCLEVVWRLGDGSRLVLAANLANAPGPSPSSPPAGRVLWGAEARGDVLPPWAVIWALEPAA
ncbi:MAG: malto-oligosyltrehalose trehalohydrolase [Alphaproteobacteria bacterium]|nr:malto-oligosyltrehalose trehalohydrolase [Alphaproteobacteria bacterium]